WVGVFHAFGLYGSMHLSAAEEFRRIISATSVGVAILLITVPTWLPDSTRARVAFAWLAAIGLELVARRVWRWCIRILRRRGDLAMRTIVVGTNEEAERIIGAMARPVRGFVPLGFVETAAGGGRADAHRVLGRVDRLGELVRELGAECVFVAASSVSQPEVLAISRLCRREGVEMRVSANLPDILVSRLTVQSLDDVLTLSIKPARLSPTQAALKRSFDVTLGLIGGIVMLPVMLIVAVLVPITSPGPVLFRQTRVTKDGRPFTMLKFRTMVRDPDRALQGKLIDLTKPFFKLRDDPRLTRIGRFLRATSLDELPQLWNVIRGDMSLVGPRPLPADQVAANQELLEPRHEVRAGLTGWWQVNGRSEVEVERALQMDLFYIENWSLSLDLYILLKTIGILVAGRGAY
ncbi:MAG TPA: sugar transferase, partial [Actinomycetota bacterium]|nr:sugar transferase [Actinomycetota bacterium]